VTGSAAHKEIVEIIDEMTGEIMDVAIDAAGGREKFRVTDLETFDWAARKLDGLVRRQQQIRSAAVAEQLRIGLWATREVEKLDGGVAYFRGLLEAYHKELLAEDPKRKTVSTLYATSTARKKPDNIEYEDDAMLVWLDQAHRDDLIRVKREPNRSEIKKAALAGELPTDAPIQTVAGQTEISVRAASEAR
jgi:hypothetical protein